VDVMTENCALLTVVIQEQEDVDIHQRDVEEEICAMLQDVTEEQGDVYKEE
jgi:hypothetical protein